MHEQNRLYRHLDVWRHVDEREAFRYRCFQRLSDGFYCVSSCDRYTLPPDPKAIAFLDNNFLELFMGVQLENRTPFFPTLEEAIKSFDKDFC